MIVITVFFHLIWYSFVAGFVGTVLMTISQEIELRFINKRPISFTPAQAFYKLFRLDFEKLSYKAKVRATYIIHFGYGTVWGFPLALHGLFGYPVTISVGAIYFVIILLQGWITLWALGITGPPWSWGRREVISELVHKIIYAVFVTSSFALLLN